MFKVGMFVYYHGEEVYVAMVDKHWIGIVEDGSAIIKFVPRYSLKLRKS